ncbi:MAG: FAD-dependent oxidoreductase [Burkholderiaceae bacterium]
MPTYQYREFNYQRPPELATDGPSESTVYPVAIIGAGPIGLAAAIDLALQGMPSVVLDDNNVVSVGSRAICWAKRTLEIFDRLGVGDRMLNKGVTWKTGRLFHRDQQVYHFDLLPEDGHKMPAFINLQQYYVEQFLVERAQEFPDLIDLRFKNKVVDHLLTDEMVTLDVETPDGRYRLHSQYVLACDGAGSPTRQRMGLPFEGQTFEEQFLIVDIEMPDSPFETDTPERWFWFEPSFHQGQSALLHKQPDNIYRIDLQLGPDADPLIERREENVVRRIKAIVGDKPFSIDWTSVYKFTCAKLDRFVHGRMIFTGDSAHVVSPFGARGGNGGIQDVDNLCWKLAAVIRGEAPPDLLMTYDEERTHGSSENIRNSARATNFMTPKSPIERIFRDETLRLAEQFPFARKLVNSGRLSQPCSLQGLRLQTPAADSEHGLMPGQACVDAPVAGGKAPWLLNYLGPSFALLSVGPVDIPDLPAGMVHIAVNSSETAGDDTLTRDASPGDVSTVYLSDDDGRVTERYQSGKAYLIRPDQHIAARFDARVTGAGLDAALSRATGQRL